MDLVPVAVGNAFQHLNVVVHPFRKGVRVCIDKLYRMRDFRIPVMTGFDTVFEVVK